MGAFFLCRRHAGDDNAPARARETLARQGFERIDDLSTGRFSILYCSKQGADSSNVYRRDRDNFCFTVGTLIYGQQTGVEASRALFEDLAGKSLDRDALYGNFAIIHCRHGIVHLYTDPQGVYNVWHDTARQVFSSSFPVMFELAARLSVDPIAVYQQVFQEATFGGRTLFNEIARMKVGTAYVLDDACSTTTSLGSEEAPDTRDELDFHVQRMHHRLSRQFEAIAACFGAHIDSALSGGYDSRLLLALCREQQVTPHLHVYGKDSSPDVQVAKRLCQGEGITLSHEDKSAYPAVTPEQFPDIVRNNFYAFQGNCADGILDNGSDLDTRRSRTRGGRLLLNGGGGEVMRNFFYLPDRSYRVQELLWSFYSRFDPAVTTSRFSERAYYDSLARSIREQTGIESGRLDRHSVEYLYAGFRCTYWMGQNNAINNQFGWFLTPFVDQYIARPAHDIPISLKNHGRFQGALINTISPALANYPSDYGHNFQGPVPLKRRLKDWTTLARPPLLRKYTYRLKKQSRQHWPYYLQDSFVKQILPHGFDYMQAFFQLQKITDAEQFKRICTIEYLLQHTGASLERAQH